MNACDLNRPHDRGRIQHRGCIRWHDVVACVVLGSMSLVAVAQDKSTDEIDRSKGSISSDDSSKETADSSSNDSESGIEAVLDQIEQSARRTGNQIATTIQKMRDVQSRVKKADTGRETQQLQKQILSDLDALIQAAKQQQQNQQQHQQNQQNQQPQNQQQQSNQQQQRSPQQRPDEQQQPSESNQPTPDGQRQDGQESATQTSQAQAAASEAAQRKVILQQVWGHLPERLRERVLNMKDDRYLPKYEGIIRQYFEALAEKRVGKTGR